MKEDGLYRHWYV